MSLIGQVRFRRTSRCCTGFRVHDRPLLELLKKVRVINPDVRPGPGRIDFGDLVRQLLEGNEAWHRALVVGSGSRAAPRLVARALPQ